MASERKREIEEMLHQFDSGEVVGLTKWEEDFIISITEAFQKWGDLTEKQLNVLKTIYHNRS